MGFGKVKQKSGPERGITMQSKITVEIALREKFIPPKSLDFQAGYEILQTIEAILAKNNTCIPTTIFEFLDFEFHTASTETPIPPIFHTLTLNGVKFNDKNVIKLVQS